MRTFGSMSIRSQIVVMMILLAAAMFGLIAYSGVKQRNHDLNEVRNLTAGLTRRAASEIGTLAAGTELLLSVISKDPSLQQRNAPAIDTLLADIVKQHPQYANLIVVDKTGRLWSSAVPFKGAVSYSDRRYFINGLSTGRFSSGEYTVGRLLASPVITYGFPVRNPSGEITGLTAAVIRLERYKELLDEQRLPAKATITLIDHRGIILYHSLLPHLAGKQDRADFFKQMTDGTDEGSLPSRGENNSNAVTYYRKLWLPGEQTPYMYLRVSTPYDSALNKANGELMVNILLMSSFVLLAIGIASRISKRYIIDKITTLQRASQKIAHGDLDVRVAASVSGGELGALGHAFDEMAHSLRDDITERKAIENALRETTERFMTMFEQAPLGIALIDSLTGRFDEVNAKFAEIAGRPKDEMAHIDWMRITHPDDLQENLDNMALLNAGKMKSYDVNMRYVRPDGCAVWTHLTIAPILGDDQAHPHHLCMIEDITERRKMDQELLKAQKLESIGLLAGGIAHDFNNLLGSVFGYIEMAKIEADDLRQKDIAQYLAKALGVFDRAKELTQQLLTFSKGGAPILKSQSIGELLRRTMSFALSGSNTHPDFLIPDDLWLNEFDETQMAQVFDNIAINAREAMPQGGTIDVIAQNIPAGKGSETGVRKPSVLISIRDHGTGIVPEHLPHIFDPFFTTKNHGSGLGLSTCYSIIKQHGGSIEVDSEMGGGSTFRIYLPASMKPAAAAKAGDTLELPFQTQ